MRYADAQFLISLARANSWAAMITSGAYKDQRSNTSDAELLARAVGVMNAHLSNASDTAEAIGELNNIQFGDCNKTSDAEDVRLPDGGRRDNVRDLNTWREK